MDQSYKQPLTAEQDHTHGTLHIAEPLSPADDNFHEVTASTPAVTNASPGWIPTYERCEAPTNGTSQAFDDYDHFFQSPDSKTTVLSAEPPWSAHAGEEGLYETAFPMAAMSSTLPDWMSFFEPEPTSRPSADGALLWLDDINHALELPGMILPFLTSVPEKEDYSDAQSALIDKQYTTFEYKALSQDEALADQNSESSRTAPPDAVDVPVVPTGLSPTNIVDSPTGPSMPAAQVLPPPQPSKRKRTTTFTFKEVDVGAKKLKGDKYSRAFDHDEKDPTMLFYNYNKAP